MPRRTLLVSFLAFATAVAVVVSCAGGTEPTPAAVPSAATSTVTVSAATVPSGTAVAVLLQARDASGANITSGGATVAFALSGNGTSSGTFGTVNDQNN